MERVRQAVAECWVVALTGTSLINHTFDDVMAMCRLDAFVLLLGPSAPLSPVLFEAEVSATSGTRITDPERGTAFGGPRGYIPADQAQG